MPNVIPVKYFQQEQKDRDRRDQEAALEEARNKVLDCPLCGKKLKTTNVSSVNSLRPSDAIWWQIWVNIGSGNGLLPDGTKPLPEPMLT